MLLDADAVYSDPLNGYIATLTGNDLHTSIHCNGRFVIY